MSRPAELLFWQDRVVAQGRRASRFAQAVAEHKSIFFAESTPDGAPIDHGAAVTCTLTLAPTGDARKALSEADERMVEECLILDPSNMPPFAAF